MGDTRREFVSKVLTGGVATQFPAPTIEEPAPKEGGRFVAVKVGVATRYIWMGDATGDDDA